MSGAAARAGLDAADAAVDAFEATRIVAIRHGETAWNVASRIQGQLDEPLNALGRWQATEMAAALVDEGIDVIYSSDLSRALDTARALAARTGAPLAVDRGLRERAFGSFEGLTFTEIEQRWPDESARWRRRDPAFGPSGGEVLADFYARCITTATRIAGAHPGRNVALVAHGGVLDCLYRAATRVALDAPRTWLVGNASINRLLYTPQGFTLVGWADNQHLDRAPRDEPGDDASAVAGAAA